MMRVLATPTVGDLLRDWRRKRRFSQLDLALETEVSTRHLSFIESGRATPSRDMLLRLAQQLDLPPRERNRLLIAGGYAPQFIERSLGAPDMAAARKAVDAVLRAYEPCPALAVDRHWTLVAANRGLELLLPAVAAGHLEPPVNVLRLSFAPDGLAPLIVNLGEWRHHILERLRRDAAVSGDSTLDQLHDELRRLPTPVSIHNAPASKPSANCIAVPLIIRHPTTGMQLSFLSTTTVFGTATDIALAELTLEGFLPADEVSRKALAEGIATAEA